MRPIREAVRSSSFVEHSLLLFLTAVLTGLGVPFVNGRLAEQRLEEDQRRALQQFREQRAYEAQLSRQGKMIDAQNALLEEVDRTLAAFQHRALAVAWYRTEDPDEGKYRRALAAYDSASWPFFVEMDAALGRTERLASAGAYDALNTLYGEQQRLDSELVALSRRQASIEEWRAMYSRITQSGERRKSAVRKLADDFGLTRGAEGTPR